MINHIRKVAVIEDGSPDNIVVLTNISEGVDGASDFGYELSETTLTIDDGQTTMDAWEHTLDIRSIVGTTSEESQLDTWTDNLTQVYISVLGIDGGVLFGDAQNLTDNIRLYKDNQFDSDNKAHKVYATRKTVPGFDDNSGIYASGIWAGSNLLGMYEWGDADSDGIADGWAATGFTTTSFASGQQTLEADTTQRDFERAIWFPFEEEQITFSIDNDSRSGTYSTEQIEIEFIDTSDSVISSQITTFSSTGRKSVTATTPSGSSLAKVICRFSIQASSTTVTSIVSDPALKLGTESTYSKF